MKILYKVEPVDPSTIHIGREDDPITNLLIGIFFLGVGSLLFLIQINYFFGGYLWLWVLGISVTSILLFKVYQKLDYNSTFDDRRNAAAD